MSVMNFTSWSYDFHKGIPALKSYPSTQGWHIKHPTDFFKTGSKIKLRSMTANPTYNGCLQKLNEVKILFQ